MFFLPTSYREAFSDVHTFQDNPLATLERRRSERRLSDKVILVVCLAAMLGMMALILWAWARIQQFLTKHIPNEVGGNYGSMLFIAVCGLHFWFVRFTANRRTNQFFLQEYRRGSLQALLSTTFTPFQLVLQAAIFPFIQGMLVAAAGFPFYVAFLHMGGVTWADLATLFLIFAMAAFSPPRWRVPVFSGLAPQEIQKKKKRGRGTTGWEIIWALGFMLWVFGWILNPIFGSGWYWQLFVPLGELLDKHVRLLWPSIFIGWPFMAGRWLLSPIAFYSIALPPILFVVPLYCVSQILGIWHTSMYLRTEDEKQLERLWDLPGFWKLRFTFTLLVSFSVLGFCWKPFVASKLTASLLTLRFAQPGQDLAGLLWLIGLFAAFMFWERIFCFKQANRDELDPYSARYIGAEMKWSFIPLFALYALYVIGCLLSRRSPFPPAVVTVLPGMLASTFAGGFLSRSLVTTRAAHVCLILSPLLAFLIPGLGWLAGLSPLAGLFSLSPHTQRIANVLSPFPISLPAWFIPAGFGAAVSLMVMAFSFSKSRAKWKSAESIPHNDEQSAEYVTEPARAGKPFREKKEQPVAQALLLWIQKRYDNAVAIKELRVQLRGRLGNVELAIYATLFAVPLITVFARPDIATMILGPPSQLFYGEGLSPLAALLAEVSTLLCFLVSAIFPMMMAYNAGTAFGKERDRSTLGFVLITPMHTGSILWGKLFGLMLTAGMAMGFALAVNLLFALIVIPLAGPVIALRGLVLTSAIPILFSIAGSMLGLMYASLFRRESDASGAALLSIMAFYGVVFYVDFQVGGLAGRTSLIEATMFWELCLAVLSGIVCLVSGLLAFGRLEMLRGGDITFGPGGKR
jgi:ABC-type transport system involved in multi-copper enzyme maturation permease subunit